MSKNIYTQIGFLCGVGVGLIVFTIIWSCGHKDLNEKPRQRSCPLCISTNDGSYIFLTGDVTNGLASTAWTNRLENEVEAEQTKE